MGGILEKNLTVNRYILSDKTSGNVSLVHKDFKIGNQLTKKEKCLFHHCYIYS